MTASVLLSSSEMLLHQGTADRFFSPLVPTWARHRLPRWVRSTNLDEEVVSSGHPLLLASRLPRWRMPTGHADVA